MDRFDSSLIYSKIHDTYANGLTHNEASEMRHEYGSNLIDIVVKNSFALLVDEVRFLLFFHSPI